MKFWIGTSGVQSRVRNGHLYPEGLPTATMLPVYAERFSTTEINYTFHRIPAQTTIDKWKVQTPESFPFALKAPPKKITADYGYLRLRREDYTEEDVKRWSEFVREQKTNWPDAFVYFKHEESGIGPKLARQMIGVPGEA